MWFKVALLLVQHAVSPLIIRYRLLPTVGGCYKVLFLHLNHHNYFWNDVLFWERLATNQIGDKKTTDRRENNDFKFVVSVCGHLCVYYFCNSCFLTLSILPWTQNNQHSRNNNNLSILFMVSLAKLTQ